MKTKTALISFLTNSINTRLLSSYLKKQGYDVTCYFCVGDFNEINLNALIEMIQEKETTLVGLSLVTDDYYPAVRVTKAVKERLKVPVIWGGAHVNVKPEESLCHADMICMGEGEGALLELVEQLSLSNKPEPNIKNIWFNTEKGIVRNELRKLEENLDKFPFPDFDLDSQYIMYDGGFETMKAGHLQSEYSIMTSRGCPYKCTYCYNSYRWEQYSNKGKYLRTRSIENVIAELVEAKKIFFNLKEINFWDDSFLARKMSDFLDLSKQYREKINLPFFALIEPMAYNEEKIRILRGCGLSRLQVGIQSGSERINREIFKRGVSNEKVLKVAESINSMGIEVIYDLIFNNPYETLEDLNETLQLLMKFPKPFDLQGYNLIFYPGTEITENALKDGYISLKSDVEDYSTIQGKKDSPLSTLGSSEVSSRFYSINYTSEEKAYPNAVLSMMAFNHIPSFVFRYFSGSETAAKKAQLKLFSTFYTSIVGLKNALS